MSYVPYATPAVPRELIQCGANNNFAKLEPDILEQVLVFGECGQEIAQNKRMPQLVMPTESDAVYPLVEGVMTASAVIRFGRDLDQYYVKLADRTKHAAHCFTFLLSLLSVPSKDALTNLDSDKLVAAKSSVDSFALWEMIMATHAQNSCRARQRYFVDLLNVRQTGTHDTYVRELRAAIKLVGVSFESVDHKGYICLDALSKVFYLNGLDQTFFNHPLNRLMEEHDKVKFSFSQCVQLCQAFYLDRGSVASSSTVVAVGPSLVQGKALVADANPNASRVAREDATRQRKLLIGVFDSSSGHCEHCWSNGFKQVHAKATCTYYLGFLARKKKLGSNNSSNPRVLVASAETSVPVPSIVQADPVVVTSAVPSSFAADQQLVQLHRERLVTEREAAYKAACDRMAARPNGYCVVSDCMDSVHEAESMFRMSTSTSLDNVVAERMAAYERACAALTLAATSSCPESVRVDSSVLGPVMVDDNYLPLVVEDTDYHLSTTHGYWAPLSVDDALVTSPCSPVTELAFSWSPQPNTLRQHVHSHDFTVEESIAVDAAIASNELYWLKRAYACMVGVSPPVCEYLDDLPHLSCGLSSLHTFGASAITQWFYDNCASVSIVNALASLVEVVLLPDPFHIGGVKDGILVTHMGYLPFLPRTIGVAFYSASASVNLISLGYLQAMGCSYSSYVVLMVQY
jgi:hypothetical protein